MPRDGCIFGALRPRSLSFALFVLACGGSAVEQPDAGVVAQPPPRPDAGGAVADAPERGAPHPVVLVHGFGGFRNLGPLGYFFSIQGQLAARGVTVYVSEALPFAASDERGAEVAAFARTVLAATGASKVNLVAHSQGGLDARVAAALLGDRVASVTTISTPHRGTPMADLVLEDLGGLAPEVASRFLDYVGARLYGEDSTRAREALEVLSRAGAARFNERFPDRPEVRYFSLAGRSGLVRDDHPDCAVPDEELRPAFVRQWAATVDALDPLFAAIAPIVGMREGTVEAPAPNDGLISVRSARWGRFLGCIPADHGDEIGQPLGTPPGSIGGPPFDSILLFEKIVEFLRAEGL